MDAPSHGLTSERPSRAAAIVIALLLPCGTGHQYVGLRRRGLGWLAASIVVFVAATLVVRIGGGLGMVPFALLGLAIAVGWVGPLLELMQIKADRFTRVPLWHVALFAALAWIVGGGVRVAMRGFVVEAFKIPSGGMFPSLYVNDNIFVDKAAYGLFSRHAPAYGDAIVFEYPDPSPTNPRQDFVQRAVAFGGDTIAVESGHPVINGWRVPSCRVDKFDFRGADSTAGGDLYVEFLGDHSYLTWSEDDQDPGKQGPYRVKPGETWVLGDNRNNSSDSRAWLGGRGAGVPDELVKGRAESVWLAFRSDKRLSWERTGTDLNGEPWLPSDAHADVVAGVRRCLSERPAQTVPPRATSASL